MTGFFATIKDTLGRWAIWPQGKDKSFLADRLTQTAGETRIYQFQLDEHGNMHPLPGVRQWEPRPDPRCTCNAVVHNAGTRFEMTVHTAECAQTVAHRATNSYGFSTRQLHISAPSRWEFYAGDRYVNANYHNGEYSPSTTPLKCGPTDMDLTQQVTIQRAVDTQLIATEAEQSTSKSTFGPASVVKYAYWFHIGCDSATRDAFRDNMAAEQYTDFRFVIDGEVFDVSLERLTHALAYLRLLDDPKR